MATSGGSALSAPEQRGSNESQPKRDVLERGFGRDFNIAIIAALLGALVAFPISLFVSRVDAESELRREQLRSLEQAIKDETQAALIVVAEGLPAEPLPVQGVRSVSDALSLSVTSGLPGVTDNGASQAKLAMANYVSAKRDCEAAREAVEDALIKDASRKVSDLDASIVEARSVEDAKRYDPELAAARKKALELINEALR